MFNRKSFKVQAELPVSMVLTHETENDAIWESDTVELSGFGRDESSLS